MENLGENNFQNIYLYFSQIKKCYDCLIDEESREIFYARLMLDLNLSERKAYEIIWKYLEKNESSSDFIKKIKDAVQKKNPIIFYGLGSIGKEYLKVFRYFHLPIEKIFDQKYEEIKNIMGIPVVKPPEKMGEVPQNAIIVVSTGKYKEEILNKLIHLGVAEEKILTPERDNPNQYFDFMQYYRQDTDFIDAGCYDCGTSYLFHQKSQGKYHEIIAFEPDEKNYIVCKRKKEDYFLQRLHLIRAGIGKTKGKVSFISDGTASCISEDGKATIDIETIDNISAKRNVGFIKMDIEGAELNALQGAKNTIQRNQPLCAICVYHKPGDVLAVMCYLKSLVPSYHFALRHYTCHDQETVLYAFYL